MIRSNCLFSCIIVILSVLSTCPHIPNQSETIYCILNSPSPGVRTCLRYPGLKSHQRTCFKPHWVNIITQCSISSSSPASSSSSSSFPRVHFRSKSLYCLLLAPLKIASTINRWTWFSLCLFSCSFKISFRLHVFWKDISVTACVLFVGFL